MATRGRHLLAGTGEDFCNLAPFDQLSGEYESPESSELYLESFAAELSTPECIQHALPLLERMMHENRMLQDALRDNAQLYSGLQEKHAEHLQKLQEKYTMSKAYAQDLQKRTREDSEVIKNLETQLKEYRKGNSTTGENTPEIAGKLEQEKLRAKQAENDLASTRQEAARTAAELTKQRLVNQQKDDDYEKTIQEQKAQIRELQKQLVAMKEAESTRAPKCSAAPSDIRNVTKQQDKNLAAFRESSKRDQKERLQGKEVVQAWSQQQQQPSQNNPPLVPPRRVRVASPDIIRQGVDYKTRCEELETKLVLHDSECRRHAHKINHLQVTLTSLTSDLEVEKANSQHKSEKLWEMKDNFELICKEYNELLEKYQEHCIQQPATSPAIQKEVRENMDFMMAQIIAAEDMVQDRDDKIAKLTKDIQAIDLNSQRQEAEILNYVQQLEEERAKLQACEKARAALWAHINSP